MRPRSWWAYLRPRAISQREMCPRGLPYLATISSPLGSLHLHAGWLLCHRQEAYTSTPATYVATSLPGDIVPVQDGYIVNAWRPKPPR
uniref:Uncharacterized protein n=1 Tax=Oryza glumipatula TaxID=40148 RepID=A0A0D9YAU1_9ORYZ